MPALRSLILAATPGLWAALSIGFLSLVSTPALAMNPFVSDGDKASTDWVNRNIVAGQQMTDAQAYFVAIMIDPPVAGLTSLRYATYYDVARFTFREDLSGLLCEFSVGGDCPAPATVYGVHRASDLPTYDYTTGQPLQGATLAVHNDSTIGLLEIEYLLADPLELDGSNRYFYAMTFETAKVFSRLTTSVTFHNTPGTYSFTQVGIQCMSNLPDPVNCGSNTPVEGISVDFTGFPVPVPGSAGLALIGVFLLWRFTPGRKLSAARAPPHTQQR